MKFVPDELQKGNSPCWLIPLNEKGETIDYLDRCGTQLELEEALTGWRRGQVMRIDQRLCHIDKTVAGGIRRTLEACTNLEKPITFRSGLGCLRAVVPSVSVLSHSLPAPRYKSSLCS
jgi:hypothetical protein